MNCVFILGAGASRQAGGPLMNDFLDQADGLRRRKSEEVGEHALNSFENVFDAIGELQGVFAKSRLDLDNIEALFGAIEMGILLDKLAKRKPDEIRKLHDDLVTLIYKTLEAVMWFPVRAEERYGDRVVRLPRVLAPKPYPDFVNILTEAEVARSTLGDPLTYSFLTFNYDLALDVALDLAQVPFSYGLSEEEEEGKVPLLKLHGSINWGKCPECSEIVPSPVGSVDIDLQQPTRSVRYALGSGISRMSHCGGVKLESPPIIVPPTWNKMDGHKQLQTVWRRATRLLAEADNIFVVGYSLPETDQFFRYLYALGSESQTRIKRFWVFDPEPAVEARFRALIGPGIESRFRFFPMRFESANSVISKALTSKVG